MKNVRSTTSVLIFIDISCYVTPKQLDEALQNHGNLSHQDALFPIGAIEDNND